MRAIYLSDKRKVGRFHALVKSTLPEGFLGGLSPSDSSLSIERPG
jgi:hypothetical protein